MKQIDEILELKNKGLSYAEISEKLNIPYNTVKSYLRRNNENTIKSMTKKCLCCGNEIKQVEGKRERLFCSPYCRLKFWRAKKNGK